MIHGDGRETQVLSGIWIVLELGVWENYFSITFLREVGSEVMRSGRQVNISLALPLCYDS